jgi:hypothetical protein
MRRLSLTAAAVLSVGCGTCLAQTAAMPNVTMPPSSTLAPAFPGLTSSSHPAGAAGSTLGAIPFNLGIPIGGSNAGAIQICPEAETAGATANFPVDQTDATSNSVPGFGTSTMSGGCSAGSPASSPGIITESVFSSGAVPLSVTEAGGLGLSPLVAVPYSAAPSTSCASNSGTSESSGLLAPYYTDVAGTPAQPGC